MIPKTKAGTDKGLGSDFRYGRWDEPGNYGSYIKSDPGDEVEHIEEDNK
jgi:hypothetical protein